MQSSWLVVSLLALLPAAAGTAPRNNKVLINSTSTTDTPAKPGQASSEAAAIARLMEIYTRKALAERYPCMPSITPTDLANLLGHEKDLQLLGASEDPGSLTAIANAADAGYLIHISVVQLNGSASITITVINARTAAVIGKYLKVIPINRDTMDVMDAFAKTSVNAIGAGFPACPGKDWKGMVTQVVSQAHSKTNVNGGKIQNTGDAKLTCVLTGEGTTARCSYTSDYTMQGDGGTIVIKKNATNAEIGIRTTLSGGKLTINIGKLPVMMEMKDSNGTPGLGAGRDEVNIGSFEVPAGPDPKRQSGNWTNPNPSMKELGVKETVTWSLSKE